jgi:hypothetical protein
MLLLSKVKKKMPMANHQHQKHIKLGAENIESVEAIDYFLP